MYAADEIILGMGLKNKSHILVHYHVNLPGLVEVRRESD